MFYCILYIFYQSFELNASQEKQDKPPIENKDESQDPLAIEIVADAEETNGQQDGSSASAPASASASAPSSAPDSASASASASARASASASAPASAPASAKASANATSGAKEGKGKVPKRKVEEKELEFLSNMSNAVDAIQRNQKEKREDDVDDFVKNIGNKLRKIQDPRVRAIAEFEIETICFKANLRVLNQQIMNSNPKPINSQPQYINSQPQSINSQPQPINSQPKVMFGIASPPQQSWVPQYQNSAIIGDQGLAYAQL